MKILSLKLINLIDIIMFFYILSLYLLTYREGFFIISNALALIFIGLVWASILRYKKNIIFNKMLIIYLLFIYLSLITALFALDQNIALTKINTLALLFILMFSLVNYIDTFVKIKRLMISFVFAGIIASIYILIVSDLSQPERFGRELGNVNSIGMIIGISSIFCFYFLIVEKKYLYSPFLLMMIFVIVLTGSRKSLLFILIAFIMISIFQNGKKISSKIKKILSSIVITLIAFYLIYNIPYLYQIIGFRMEELFSFVNKGSDTVSDTSSIGLRSYMIESGLVWFKEQPLTGYGLNNFRVLFNEVSGGAMTYSHNNLIELLVGTGIFGAFLFYLTHIVVVKDLFKASKTINKTLCFTFIAIIISYTLTTVSLVYYDSKHFIILLAVASVIPRIIKEENYRSESSNLR